MRNFPVEGGGEGRSVRSYPAERRRPASRSPAARGGRPQAARVDPRMRAAALLQLWMLLPCAAGLAAPRVARDAQWEAALRPLLAAVDAPFRRTELQYWRDGADGRPSYGVLYEPRDEAVQVTATGELSPAELPGVVLFHTAAGPRDLFLDIQARKLVALGFVVLIADCYSDRDGAGWEGTFNQERRAELAAGDGEGYREQARLALQVLGSLGRVAPGRLGCVGYCLGGRLCLEALRQSRQLSQPPAPFTVRGSWDPTGAAAAVAHAATPVALRGAVSVHGVLNDAVRGEDAPEGRLLVLHGGADALAAPGLEAFVARGAEGLDVRVVEYAGAQHGFSNPAQRLNREQAGFDYDEGAAAASWGETADFLRDALSGAS